jgi:hypothetical protein
MDYELINEINDNDRREMEEYRIEEEEETMQKSTFKEGSIINGALGIYIPYNVVLFAIDYGYIPTNEFKGMQKDAQIKEIDECDYIFDEMENAEDWLNAEIADNEHYFGTILDGTDWGYWKVEDDLIWLSERY